MSGHPIVSTGDKTTEEKSKKVEEKACNFVRTCYTIPSYERYNKIPKLPECHLQGEAQPELHGQPLPRRSQQRDG